MREKEHDFIAEGYSFQNAKDALTAAQERKKTEYLEARMDHSKPEAILNVYNKAVAEQVFKTPVGIGYLKKLQEYLISQGIEKDKILPVSIGISYSIELRDHTNPARKRIRPSVKKKTYSLGSSILLNILLGAAVVIMFSIALKSEEPNIFNYKQAITDKYAEWEQDLTHREAVVREKERQLNINLKE